MTRRKREGLKGRKGVTWRKHLHSVTAVSRIVHLLHCSQVCLRECLQSVPKLYNPSSSIVNSLINSVEFS